MLPDEYHHYRHAVDEYDQTVIESRPGEDWLAWAVHGTGSAHAPGAPQVMMELPAVKEMISLVAEGSVTGPELHDALDDFARRLRTSGGAAGGAAGGTGGGTGGCRDDAGIGDDCPHHCAVCAGAREEFDAIAAESLTHKVRLADPDRHPYAAGRHTLHRSSCPQAVRFVGGVEPVGSPCYLAGLPPFAHRGVCSTAWAAGMQVLTEREAAEWVRRQTGPYGGSGFRRCGGCLPPVP